MNDKDPTTLPLPEYSDDTSVRELIEAGQLEEAVVIVSGVTYNSRSGYEKLSDLKRVLGALCESERGAKSAIDLVDILVPRPQTADDATNWQKKYEASFYDYVIQDLAIAALKQKDFQTATEVVDRMDDWYIGSAMDGDDLLELAYRADDPAILASVWALIAKRWGNGRAAEDIPALAASVSDQATINAINTWLSETAIEYRIPELEE